MHLVNCSALVVGPNAYLFYVGASEFVFGIVCEVHVCTLVSNIYDKGNIVASCFLNISTARVDRICYEFIYYLDFHCSFFCCSMMDQCYFITSLRLDVPSPWLTIAFLFSSNILLIAKALQLPGVLYCFTHNSLIGLTTFHMVLFQVNY